MSAVYTVSLSWREHMSRSARIERTVVVEAFNRDQALLFAGLRLAQDGVIPFKPSVQIESVTKRRIP